MSKKAKEMIGGCCVCSDESGWSENPLVYCDGAGCNVAVHQACYGIVQVPSGPWFCRKCESQERVARVKCELCPQRAGALKRTDAGGWCHVVCALYIPEAWFANVQTMEPIVLNSVPGERFNKTCYICEEQKRDTKATAGACMQCNRNSCKQYFHVTCAQAQGLLCEVTGSYDNVKYCGYCSHHYKKLKNHSNVKPIPAFKPIPNENGTPDSSPEKTSPSKPEEDTRHTVPPAIKEVKSPQVDQSVSSTSDSLPPPTIPNLKAEDVSLGCGQVSDITSAVSPSGEDRKFPLSGSDHSQEPSSSGVLSHTSALTRMLQDGASSSTEISEIDVGDGSTENVSVVERISPGLPKRQRSTEKLDKAATKKTKSNTISSTVTHKKDAPKKTTRKRRDSGGVNSKSGGMPVNPPTSTPTSLPGHHDYCGSIFGGSPYFQSLSAPGRVSLPSFSTHAVYPSYPYMGENYLYSTDDYFDSSAVLNGTSTLIPPPKQFPCMMANAPRYSQDHSQDFPLSMEQLLEQQWEQGAHFLMEQGHHFDISSLLNCLHRLKGENQSLEDQVRELTSRRDHLMAVNARLSLPLSMYDGGSLHSKSSSLGSLEDISSPDDVQVPKLGMTPLTSVQIPSNSDLLVEDILSPVESDHPSLCSRRLETGVDGAGSSHGYVYPDQVCPPQPLMYSVVNPPPPTLSIMSSTMSSSSSSSSLLSSSSLPSSSSLQSSSSLHSSSSSSPLSISQGTMPTLEPSQIPNVNSLSLPGHISKLTDLT